MDDMISQTSIKQINRLKIFQYIYNNKGVTKQNIAYVLRLSLPTVTMNLADFMEENLITCNGLAQSTGGRKARIYSVNPDVRYAIGIDIWSQKFILIISNLFGQTVLSRDFELAYSNSEAYLSELCRLVIAFVQQNGIAFDSILGAGVSIQGILSDDEEQVVYGDAMNTIGITRRAFQEKLPWDVHLIRNVEAAAAMEIWSDPSLTDCVYLMLNAHFNGTVIINSNVYHGISNRAGTVEHMCLVPDGRQCYCGKKGCVEAYCSGNSILQDAGEELPVFFEQLRQNAAKETTIWHDYLRKLALAIDNIRMLWKNPTILSGCISNYMRDEDVQLLENYICEQTAFKDITNCVSLSALKENSAAQGASLYFIQKFVQEI